MSNLITHTYSRERQRLDDGAAFNVNPVYLQRCGKPLEFDNRHPRVVQVLLDLSFARSGAAYRSPAHIVCVLAHLSRTTTLGLNVSMRASMDIGRSSNTLLPMRATCFPEAAMHVQSRFRLSSSDGDNERTKTVRSWTQVRLGEQHVACSDAMRPSFLVNLEVDTLGPLPTDHYRPGDVQTKSSHDPVNAFE